MHEGLISQFLALYIQKHVMLLNTCLFIGVYNILFSSFFRSRIPAGIVFPYVHSPLPRPSAFTAIYISQLRLPNPVARRVSGIPNGPGAGVHLELEVFCVATGHQSDSVYAKCHRSHNENDQISIHSSRQMSVWIHQIQKSHNR